jgi:hypothetical protein
MRTRIDIRTQVSSGEWVRPAGWLALPDISTTDKKYDKAPLSYGRLNIK